VQHKKQKTQSAGVLAHGAFTTKHRFYLGFIGLLFPNQCFVMYSFALCPQITKYLTKHEFVEQ
jgi:hypothetical protein